MGSRPGCSGIHTGRQVAVIVRLFVEMTIDKVGGEKVDGFASFDVPTVGMRSVGMANVVTSKEKAKQMIKARDSIEGSNAV